MATVLERVGFTTRETTETTKPKFTITSRVPLPPRVYNNLPQRKQSIYPFDEMLPGDSFEVPLAMQKNSDIRCLQSRLTNAANQWKRRTDPTAKFATRQIDGRAVRVWRTA